MTTPRKRKSIPVRYEGEGVDREVVFRFSVFTEAEAAIKEVFKDRAHQFVLQLARALAMDGALARSLINRPTMKPTAELLERISEQASYLAELMMACGGRESGSLLDAGERQHPTMDAEAVRLLADKYAAGAQVARKGIKAGGRNAYPACVTKLAKDIAEDFENAGQAPTMGNPRTSRYVAVLELALATARLDISAEKLARKVLTKPRPK